MNQEKPKPGPGKESEAERRFREFAEDMDKRAEEAVHGEKPVGIMDVIGEIKGIEHEGKPSEREVLAELERHDPGIKTQLEKKHASAGVENSDSISGYSELVADLLRNGWDLHDSQTNKLNLNLSLVPEGHHSRIISDGNMFYLVGKSHRELTDVELDEEIREIERKIGVPGSAPEYSPKPETVGNEVKEGRVKESELELMARMKRSGWEIENIFRKLRSSELFYDGYSVEYAPTKVLRERMGLVLHRRVDRGPDMFTFIKLPPEEPATY